MTALAQVVVEGVGDRLLLSSILIHARPDLASKVGVMQAGGSGEVLGLGRSMLYRHRIPVALLLDADALDEDTIAQRRSQILAYLARAPAAPFDVFFAVPVLEATLFSVPGQAAIERLCGHPLSVDQVRAGQSSPGRTLVDLFGGDPLKVISDRLSPEEARSLAALEPFAGLIRFLDASLSLMAENRAA